MEIDPASLGTLELGGMWVPYVDMVNANFIPTRITLGKDEYAYESSMIVSGHGAVLPGRIKELRSAGKKPVILERGNRYYVYVSPP